MILQAICKLKKNYDITINNGRSMRVLGTCYPYSGTVNTACIHGSPKWHSCAQSLSTGHDHSIG